MFLCYGRHTNLELLGAPFNAFAISCCLSCRLTLVSAVFQFSVVVTSHYLSCRLTLVSEPMQFSVAVTCLCCGSCPSVSQMDICRVHL